MLTHIFTIAPIYRVVLAALTAGLISIVLTYPLIAFLLKRKIQDGESRKASATLQEIHKTSEKASTPTMGGIAIFASIILSAFLWAEITAELISGLLGALCFFALGAIDDISKLRKRQGDGLRFKQKIALQVLISLLVGLALYLFTDVGTDLRVLNFGNVELGLGFIAFNALVLVASSNASNLTDGLDGLAAGVVAIVATGLCILAFPQSLETALISAILAGSLLGFLWFNSFPAKIFMGDTGSLTIGFLIGIFAILIKAEILIIPLAAVLVAEALSVIIQVLYYKKTKKRIFLCAPLHHHYQFKGVPENQIVMRFWLVSIFFATITVSAYFALL